MINRETPPHPEGFLRETEACAAETARKLVERLTLENRTLALAESCTGGLVSEFITRINGASAVFWGSFVTYSAAAKETMLSIDKDFLARFTTVSRETTREMALKTLKLSGASISAAVTGLAGPGGNGVLPAGTVYVAVAHPCGVVEKKLFFRGTRAEVKMQAAAAVLEELFSVPAM